MPRKTRGRENLTKSLPFMPGEIRDWGGWEARQRFSKNTPLKRPETGGEGLHGKEPDGGGNVRQQRTQKRREKERGVQEE